MVVVVVVMVYNSNSEVVVHFLMSTNERTKVGEEEKNKTPSFFRVTSLPFLWSFAIVSNCKMVSNFFLDVDKRKKVLGNGFHGGGEAARFFFFSKF